MPVAAASKPSVPGYITAFRPNLTYANGDVPRVDVVHLHHGVWIVGGETRWATGEEKTKYVRWSTPTSLPAGTYTYFCRHPFMRGGFRVSR